jgi:hypothetical protein
VLADDSRKYGRSHGRRLSTIEIIEKTTDFAAAYRQKRPRSKFKKVLPAAMQTTLAQRTGKLPGIPQPRCARQWRARPPWQKSASDCNGAIEPAKSVIADASMPQPVGINGDVYRTP